MRWAFLYIMLFIIAALFILLSETATAVAAVLLGAALALLAIGTLYLFIWPAVLEQLGRHEAASNHYSRLIRLRPRNAVLLQSRALVYQVAGDPDRALADLSAAIDARPDHSRALADRAAIYLLKKEYTLALADCERALERNPNAERAHLTRAQSLARLGDFKRAIEECDTVLAMKFSTALSRRLAYHQRASTRFRQGDFAAALADFEQMTPLPARLVSPRDKKTMRALAHAGQGFAHLALDHHPQAREHFEQAVKLDPAAAAPLAGLALAHHVLGNESAAVRAWRQAVEKDSRYQAAAWLREERGWPAELVGRAQTLARLAEERAGE